MIRKVKRAKRKNPTDFEFLKKVNIIRKKFNVRDKTEDLYQIIYNNEIIGQALYNPFSQTIESVSVKEDYRQKGLATLLHDYIEKDLNIKLIPDSNQTWYGKAFWENRLKRKNPTDLNFLKQVSIDKETFKITDGKDKIISYQYNVYLDGKRIGYAEIVKGQNTVDDVEILKPYQRKGLTTFLYDYIENDLKIKLKPSEYLDPDGKKFWESRLKSGKR